ncbi:rhodanese-like domain-containing protein [Microbacterium sp.]|uniref:rhodanese-like domain-containing protein n=1 Tax=Microbacterium sp. TaxID=51671 RepID=UPI0025E4DE46|nr:rhodanese-like domain-containing protein [Microbacterium sp.]MBT9608251.1 rhodanese-like domain-containing protein [Microbacterium sp.]
MRRFALVTVTALVAAFALTSCTAPTTAQPAVSSDAIVIDVRTPAEHAEGHLDGALLLDVTAGELQAAIPDLDPHADYVVYCRSGQRAAAAVNLMEAAGFTKVRNLGSLADAAASTGLSVVQTD